MRLLPDNEFRFVTIIGALQVGAVFLGWFLVLAAIKMAGGFEDLEPWLPRGAVFVRGFGWAFLAIPIVWIGFGIWARCSREPAWIELIAYLSGCIILVAFVIFYVNLALFSYFAPQQMLRPMMD